MNLPFPMEGTCDPAACVRGKQFRFTLVTERILRLEYDPQGIFEDRPSQADRTDRRRMEVPTELLIS